MILNFFNMKKYNIHKNIFKNGKIIKPILSSLLSEFSRTDTDGRNWFRSVILSSSDRIEYYSFIIKK